MLVVLLDYYSPQYVKFKLAGRVVDTAVCLDASFHKNIKLKVLNTLTNSITEETVGNIYENIGRLDIFRTIVNVTIRDRSNIFVSPLNFVSNDFSICLFNECTRYNMLLEYNSYNDNGNGYIKDTIGYDSLNFQGRGKGNLNSYSLHIGGHDIQTMFDDVLSVGVSTKGNRFIICNAIKLCDFGNYAVFTSIYENCKLVYHGQLLLKGVICNYNKQYKKIDSRSLNNATVLDGFNFDDTVVDSSIFIGKEFKDLFSMNLL